MGSWKKIKAKKCRRTDDNGQETLCEERVHHAVHSESTFSFSSKPRNSIMADFFNRAFPEEFRNRQAELEFL